MNTPSLFGTTILDHSGNKLNLSIIGTVPRTAGRFGAGVRFNGDVANYLGTGLPAYTFLAVSSWTLVARIVPLGSSSEVSNVYAGQGICGDFGGYCGLYRTNLAGTGDRIWAYNYDTASRHVGITYTAGEMIHVVGVFNGTNLSIYKNGRFISSIASGNAFDLSYTFRVGRAYTASFNGDIYDVRTFNRALSANEIAELYNNPSLQYDIPIDSIWESFFYQPATSNELHGTSALVLSASGLLQVALAYSRPDQDITTGGWTTHTGATTGLYEQINESVVDDNDYIQSSVLSSGSDMVEVRLSALSAAQVATNHFVRYRHRRISVSGNLAVNHTVALYDGATEIASWQTTSVSDTWQTVQHELTEVQAGSIVNYNDLRLRFTAIVP